MNILGRNFKSWGHKSITFKFSAGISLMLFLIMLVACTGYFSLHYVAKADESIRISTEIQRLIFEMDRGMERARRLHGEFFLHYPESGLNKAHENYAQPSVRQVAQVVSFSKKLREMISKTDVNDALRKSNIDLNLYLSSAKQFADTSIESFELVTLLATPEVGLEATLDKHIAKLKTELAAINAASDLYNEMKHFIDEHRVRRERFLMQSAFNSAFMLHSQIQTSPSVTIQQKKQIFLLLDQINKTANEILDIDVAIGARFKGFDLQVEAVESVSNSLIKLAGNEVQKSQQRIHDMHSITSVILFIVTLTGLLATVLIAFIINVNITRRIVLLTYSAEKLRKGNLDVVAKEEPLDELGQLGRTFNYMAVRLRELIDNLEQIIEQRTAELVISERRFRQLFEHSTSGVVIYGPIDNGKDFIIKDINHAMEKIERIRRNDVLGRKVTEIFPGVVEFGLLDVFRKVLTTGFSVKHPVSFYSDNNLQGWRENSVYKLPTGEIIAIYDDRTAEKKGEEERIVMTQQLDRAKKMEAIGLLAGGVAHDLNNILSGIVGYPELLIDELPEDSELIEPLKAIHDSGKRAAAIVADLLTVARSVANTKTDNNLNTIIKEYMASPELLKLMSTHQYIDYSVDLHTGLNNISCSPVHIKKCLMNLVTNAVEAIDGSGQIIIATKHKFVDENMAKIHNIRSGKYVVLKVSNTGSEIPQQDLGHIFEPFYTKKVMGKSGTGLGLAVVWNSMADHGGTALVESSDKETSFSLYIPAVLKTPVPVDKQKPEPKNFMGNGEKILIVDDEPQLRNLAKNILERLGYITTCVSSGEEAVYYIGQNNVDLVLLDMLMNPGMNGRQTYECILKFKPEQRAVITSGFSESEDVKIAMALGASEFILKPYSMAEFGRVIKSALS